MTIYASIMTVIHPVYHYLSDGNEPKLCPKQQSNVVRPFEIDNKGPQYQPSAGTQSADLAHRISGPSSFIAPVCSAYARLFPWW